MVSSESCNLVGGTEDPPPLAYASDSPVFNEDLSRLGYQRHAIVRESRGRSHRHAAAHTVTEENHSVEPNCDRSAGNVARASYSMKSNAN